MGGRYRLITPLDNANSSSSNTSTVTPESSNLPTVDTDVESDGEGIAEGEWCGISEEEGAPAGSQVGCPIVDKQGSDLEARMRHVTLRNTRSRGPRWRTRREEVNDRR